MITSQRRKVLKQNLRSITSTVVGAAIIPVYHS